MFTGIVKEIGRVKKIIRKPSLTVLGISSKIIYEESNPSDSISVNGICLTLIRKEKELLFFEVVKPTLQISNLKRLKMGDYLNLEPSLKLQEKLGGHIVLGHIDTEIKLKRIIRYKEYWCFEIDSPPKFKKFIIENGSVALEGISLTVKNVRNRFFTVDIIPFTYNNTNLKYKRIGDWLNIEFDYLLKKKA